MMCLEMPMDNIYEWLWDHYCRRPGSRTTDPILRNARDLLLSGRGDRLDREDALNLLCSDAETAAFAAGMAFSYRLLADFPRPED